MSRALNDRADVNPLTRQRVRDAAAKLGYSPNQSGRSLRRGQTDLVGVMIPSGGGDTPINMVFLSVLAGLKRRLSEQGLDLAIFLEDGGDDRLEPLRRVTERGLVDALIIADTMRRDPRVDYLMKLDKPFVAFGRTESPIRHAWIDPDFEGAVEGAVEHLSELGHRRIALALPDLETNYLGLIEDGLPAGDAAARASRRRSVGLAPAGRRAGRPRRRGGFARLGSEADRAPSFRFDACGRALPPPRRGRHAARPRHLDPRPVAGGAGAIAHSGADLHTRPIGRGSAGALATR